MLLHSQVLSMDNRTKGLSLWGSRMQTHRVKCLTSCPRVLKNHMRLGYTTCQITQGSTRRSADAKFQDFFPPCKTLQTGFEISPKTTMPECHANLFLTKTPCRLLEKNHIGKKNVELADKKILWIFDWCGAYLTVLTEGELSAWISRDHAVTRPWQADTCCTFYWTH